MLDADRRRVVRSHFRDPLDARSNTAMTSIKKFSMTLGGSLLLLGLAGGASAQDLGALKGGAGGDMSSM